MDWKSKLGRDAQNFVRLVEGTKPEYFPEEDQERVARTLARAEIRLAELEAPWKEAARSLVELEQLEKEQMARAAKGSQSSCQDPLESELGPGTGCGDGTRTILFGGLSGPGKPR